LTSGSQYLRYGGAAYDKTSDALMARFVDSWYARATVRRPWVWEPALDPEAPDFVTALLPFRDDPAFHQCPQHLQSACLSAAWLVYSHKTISIETQIIIPACLDLMQLSTSHRLSDRELSAVAETITDEGFHTLVAAELCRMTSSFRGIDVRMPAFDLTLRLDEQQREIADTRRFALVRLAYATVSEIFISDYLSLLSEADDIQPLFRTAVALHKADEVCHKRLFPMLVRPVVQDCSADERALFVRSLYEAQSAFASRETRLWADVLDQLYRGLPDSDGLRPPQCTEQYGSGDFEGVADLVSELGLTRPNLLEVRASSIA